jgi:hypothetical protein
MKAFGSALIQNCGDGAKNVAGSESRTRMARRQVGITLAHASGVLRPLLAAAAALLVTCAAASADEILDRKVGSADSGTAMEFRAFTSHTLGSLARAAQVPIGIELLPAPPNHNGLPPIALTGRTVREAADAMIARDPRYTYRDEAGVLLFEPVRPFADKPLDRVVPAVRIDPADGRIALDLVTAWLGAPRTAGIQFSDTKSFTLDVPEGTIRALLNASVRAHGELVWILERPRNKDRLFPYMLSFMSGPHGFGLGVAGVLTEPLDLSRFTGHDARADFLDTVVGMDRSGFPLEITGFWPAVALELSRVVRVPIGCEVIPPAPTDVPHERPRIAATGRTVREVLEAARAMDPRYDWRVVNGTVVIRPAAAWGDGSNPLFALVRDVTVQDATMTEAVKQVFTALGAPDMPGFTFADHRTVSFSVTHGTALELLAALAQAHGWLSWTLQHAEPKEIRETGLTHRLTLTVAGSRGVGVLVGFRAEKR